MQVLYDQNSERVKKRFMQMRKIKQRFNVDNESEILMESASRKGHSDYKLIKVPNSTKVFIEKEESSFESLIGPGITKNLKNDDTEVNISYIECPIEEDIRKTVDTRHYKNSLSMNLPSSNSFIQITNNLYKKSHAKLDNNTSDYLLAINLCKEENTDELEKRLEVTEKIHKRFPSVSILFIFSLKTTFSMMLLKKKKTRKTRIQNLVIERNPCYSLER